MSLEQLAKNFTTAFNNSQYKTAGELLPKIKLELAKNGLLVPKKNISNTADLLVTRDILEKGIFTSIHLRNEAEFSRLISQIHPFFFSKTASGATLPPSENQYKIIALYLLLLLSKNEIAEFHTELETLATLGSNDDSADAPLLEELLKTNVYLRYPVDLERWLMEGSYHKVWKAITDPTSVPAPEFGILAESLLFTVRDEIARSAESAYEFLPIDNARHLLYLQSDEELIAFAENQPGWVIDKIKKIITFPSTFYQDSGPSSFITAGINGGSSVSKGSNPNDLSEDFDVTESSSSGATGASSRPETIIAECLDYAREIETII